MCDGFLIKLPDGDPVCIPIVVEIEREGPQPDPWQELFLDLGRLLTVNRAIATLSDRRVSAQLSEVVGQAAFRIAEQLPEGITLGEAAFERPRAATAG